MLGGIALDLVVRLLRGYFKWDRFRLGCKTLKGVFWNSTPTRFLITLKKSPLKSSFFHFVMKHPNTRDIWDFCLGGFKGDFYRFYR